MKAKLKINSVRIERQPDYDADLSYLGEFKDDFESGQCAIIRLGQHAGEFADDVPSDQLPPTCREYRYFIPEMTGKQTGNMDSPKQDWRRMEDYSAGRWSMLGIIAKAEMWNPATHVCQTIRSGGLWGVESDSGADCLAEIERDELAGLRAELLAAGIGERAIAHAFKKVTRD